MPILELAEWVEKQVEQNPLLEIQETSLEHHKASSDFFSKKKEYDASLLQYHQSLQEHLTQQAHLTFFCPRTLTLAKLLIGHVDDRGFFTTPLNEIAQEEEIPISQLAKLLEHLQTFDPPGVFGRDVRESLLLQLRRQNKQRSLAYQILSSHFALFLRYQLPQIAKQLHLSPAAVEKIIRQEIAPLNPFPGHHFLAPPSHYITPDLHLKYEEEKWIIEVEEGPLPRVQRSPLYALYNQQAKGSCSDRKFLRYHLSRGKWLAHTLHKRKSSLRKIGKFLLAKQTGFFSGEQKTLAPITLTDMAQELQIHESTAARAVHDKYLSCPQGLFPLRYFFSQGVVCQNGQKISSHTVGIMLRQMVDKEDNQAPLSDEELSSKLTKMGIPCARRTVTKHRKKLKIASSSTRKRFF